MVLDWPWIDWARDLVGVEVQTGLNREGVVVLLRVTCGREQRQTRFELLVRLEMEPHWQLWMVEVVVLMVLARRICMGRTRHHRRMHVLLKEAVQVVEVGSIVLELVELLRAVVVVEREVLRRVVEAVVRLVLRTGALAEEQAAHPQEAVVLEQAMTGAEAPFQTVCATQAVA
jgi:hypothetical protein